LMKTQRSVTMRVLVFLWKNTASFAGPIPCTSSHRHHAHVTQMALCRVPSDSRSYKWPRVSVVGATPGHPEPDSR
jgi:hypothetical protein